jgi:hypothetical protein
MIGCQMVGFQKRFPSERRTKEWEDLDEDY